MKTTVDLDPELLKQAKKVAIDRGSSLRALIEAGLRQQMSSPQPAPQPYPWTTVAGRSPVPDEVDLSSRRSMWAWLESEEAKPGRD